MAPKLRQFKNFRSDIFYKDKSILIDQTQALQILIGAI